MKLKWFDKLNRQAPDVPGGSPDPTPATPAVPEPTPGPDLSFIPADFHVDGKPDLGKFTTSYQELVARDAQRAEAEAAAKAAIPEGDYAFTLPEDLKFDGLDLPENYRLDLLTEDETMKPLFAGLSGFLKANSLPAAASTELMGMLAQYIATQDSRAYAAQKADLAKLGTPSQVEARKSVVQRVITSRLPADQAEAILSFTTSAKALQALEALIGPNSTTPNPAPPAKSDDLAAYYASPKR
jgi:hypothetical protein